MSNFLQAKFQKSRVYLCIYFLNYEFEKKCAEMNLSPMKYGTQKPL